jgi:ABC-type sugar transport system ATPase subunit
MAVSDRILVLFHGRLIKELVTADTSVEEVVLWITGGGLIERNAAKNHAAKNTENRENPGQGTTA